MALVPERSSQLYYFKTKSAKAELPILTESEDISLFPGATSPAQPLLSIPGGFLLPIKPNSLVWLCHQPCPAGHAHCWPESLGKGGDLVLAAFEQAQGGQRISAQSFWESQLQTGGPASTP